MALMKYREPNQVKWVGCRPAHRGAQVWAYASAANGTVIIYTVPVGHILFLLEATLVAITLATGIGNLYIRNEADVYVRHLCALLPVADNPIGSDHVFFSFPMELPAGYDLIVSSNAAGLTARGNIFGWVESV